MSKVITVLIYLVIDLVLAQQVKEWFVVGGPKIAEQPCNDNDKITVTFEEGLPPDEENKYLLHIREDFLRYYEVVLKFDSDATVALLDKSSARVTANPADQRFYVVLTKPSSNLVLEVRGPWLGGLPYLKSLTINAAEYCNEPLTGYLDKYISGYRATAEIITSVPNLACGRRKVQHTELIVSGLTSKPGDWPWHAALYRLERFKTEYICGGTLLSKTFVLTAAHCVTLRGVAVLPETRDVILGKYNLVGGDIEPQEREVHQIIVHESFKHSNLDNDIALLKLRSEAVYTDYVQPACIWYTDAQKKIPPQIHGTVVGFGFDQTDTLSSKLQQATIPKIPESTCIKSNPLFYSKLLNGDKFCAGFGNGTSACNGDSGGGFLVFVPDVAGIVAEDAPGAWYIRGIVSLSVSRTDVPICDPNQYVIFTDVAKYEGWVKDHMSRTP